VDFDTWLLMGFATLIVANRGMFIGGLAARIPVLFFFVQFMNIVAASYFFGWGIPAFDGEMSLVNYFLGAWLVFHSVQNNSKYGKYRTQLRSSDDEEYDKLRQEVIDKLKKDEA